MAGRLALVACSLTVALASVVHAQPPDAKRAYDEALEHYLAADYAAAAPLFLKAAALDADNAHALLYGALSHNNLGRFAVSDSLLDRLTRMEDRLDAYDRGWLDYLRHRLDGDYERALEAIGHSARLKPESKAGYNYAWVANGLNRPAEAKRALVAVDPEAPPSTGWANYLNQLTITHRLLGEYEEALEVARTLQRRFPDRVNVTRHEAYALAALGRVDELEAYLRSISGYANRGGWTAGGIMIDAAQILRVEGHSDAADRIQAMAMAWMDGRPAEEAGSERHRRWKAWALLCGGRLAEARREFESLAQEFADDVGYRGLSGVAAALAGDEAAAAAADRELAAIDRSYLFGAHTFWRAAIAAASEDRDRAMDLLAQAHGEGRRFAWFIRYHAAFKPLVDAVEFEAYLEPGS